MKNKIDDFKVEQDKLYQNDYKIRETLTNLSDKDFRTKVIEIFDIMCNHTFGGSCSLYYKKLHTILGDEFNPVEIDKETNDGKQ